MKTLDPNKVVIAVSRHGELKLIMSNDTIKVETIWKDLQHPDFLEEAANRPDAPTRFKSVRVDLKSFVKLMSCQLPEHDIELWLYQRVCATFVVSIEHYLHKKRMFMNLYFSFISSVQCNQKMSNTRLISW